MSLFHKEICISARDSQLSIVQVEEVLSELSCFYPNLKVQKYFLKSQGDLDLKSSLLDKEKTDFFTKEIDELVITGRCHAAIHSAKDLPDPLPEGLVIAAITKGVDPCDVLVFRKGDCLDSLPPFAKVGTSSLRRQDNVLRLRKDWTFVDIRGTIQDRLALLDSGKVDACVMAKAALIRLQLLRDTCLLPGPVCPLQGKIAIVVRKQDVDSQRLFSSLHCGI